MARIRPRRPALLPVHSRCVVRAKAFQAEHLVDVVADSCELLANESNAFVAHGIVLSLSMALLSPGIVSLAVADFVALCEAFVKALLVGAGNAFAVACLASTFVGAAFHFGDEFFGAEMSEVLGGSSTMPVEIYETFKETSARAREISETLHAESFISRSCEKAGAWVLSYESEEQLTELERKLQQRELQLAEEAARKNVQLKREAEDLERIAWAARVAEGRREQTLLRMRAELFRERYEKYSTEQLKAVWHFVNNPITPEEEDFIRALLRERLGYSEN